MIATPPSSFPQPTGPSWRPERLHALDAARASRNSIRRIAICIATFLLACFTGHGEVRPPDSENANASLTFRVYNYAGIDEIDLQTASEEAQKIFRNVGIESLWTSCRTNHESDTGARCPITSNPTVLAMRILAVPLPIVGLKSDAIFGFASPPRRDGFASVANVFWSRIKTFANDKKVSPGRLLGAILAHEAGHLLLGEGSHFPVGLMKAVWAETEMTQIGQNALIFWPGQKSALHRAVAARLRAAGPRVQLASSFRSW